MNTSTPDFDWYNSNLNRTTVITENYITTENVRQFFKTEIGRPFKFNNRMVKWIKYNAGNTLGHAIEEWYAMQRFK